MAKARAWQLNESMDHLQGYEIPTLHMMYSWFDRKSQLEHTEAVQEAWIKYRFLFRSIDWIPLSCMMCWNKGLCEMFKNAQKCSQRIGEGLHSWHKPQTNAKMTHVKIVTHAQHDSCQILTSSSGPLYSTHFALWFASTLVQQFKSMSPTAVPFQCQDIQHVHFPSRTRMKFQKWGVSE